MNNKDDEKKELIDALHAYGLKQRIGELHREIVPNLAADTTQKTPIRSIRYLVMRAAAILIALVTVAAVYVFISSTSENLFNDKYVSYNIAGQRSGEPTENSAIVDLFTEGQTALKNNDAEIAMQAFNSILSDTTKINTLRDDAEYYLALAYLKAGKTDQAYNLFLQINRNKSHLYHEDISNWYLFKLKVLSWKNK